MNDFFGPQIGLPEHNNYAKKVINESGINMTVDPSVVIGAAGSLLGFFGNRSAQKSANAARNEAIQKQYEYDTELYDMRKEKGQADWDELVRNIETKQNNEIKLAEYKDANALDSYNYQMQIRNKQQDSLNKQFLKSQELYKSQIAFNKQGASLAKQSQQRALKETTQKLIFQNQDAILKQLVAEGTVRARGASGRSAGKVVQASLAQLGSTQAALAESLLSAQVNTRSAISNINLQKEIADKNAYANLMLDPGTLPVAPKPYKTLITEYNLPRPLEDFDFGPEPIKGATATYTTPWTNLAGDLLNSLATQGGPPTQNLGNFNYSNFVTPQYSNAFSASPSIPYSMAADVGNWTGGLGSYADLGSSINVKF
jgi:hypothetical protein